jgi:hypothetical protein
MRKGKEEDLLARRIHVHDLYDLYAPLLTEKQREAWELHEFSDLSLAEAAEKLGISRQAVSDLVSRSRERLEELEDLLGFRSREELLKDEIRALRSLFGHGAKSQKAEEN